ncbi:peptidoglycan-binding domain-containing protein [Streptomyces sp. NPDC045431]|uniref:peptidoglycan-binding domain-containing protein n=1 Tax=Streptomyces sp. NPDC045431 TaxID=3155613 RepID=UPI0033C80B7A
MTRGKSMHIRNKAAVLLTAGVLASGLLAGAATASAAPVRGATQAASAPDAQVPAAAPRCTLADFIGWYCGYYPGTAYSDRGDRGDKVREIQALLRFHGVSIGSSGVDGVFGADTERAVKTFQSRKGIARDGKVGPNTWYYLRTPGA